MNPSRFMAGSGVDEPTVPASLTTAVRLIISVQVWVSEIVAIPESDSSGVRLRYYETLGNSEFETSTASNSRQAATFGDSRSAGEIPCEFGCRFGEPGNILWKFGSRCASGKHGRASQLEKWPGDVSHQRVSRRKHFPELATTEVGTCRSLRSGTRSGRLGLVDGSPLQDCDGGDRSRRSSAGRYAIACRNLEQALVLEARTRTGRSFTFWDPASWHVGGRKRPAKLGRGSCRVPRSRSERSAGACVSCVNPGNLQPPSSSSTMPLVIAAMIGRPCSSCSCRSMRTRAASMKPSGCIEDRWEHLNAMGEGALEPAIKLVLQHIELTLKATPVATVRAFLEQRRRAGSRGRSGLAGSSEPGDPDGRLRRGGAVARCLPAAPSGGCPGLACPARAGASRPTGSTSSNRP